ncbi:DUF979 domain-containing protein [Undibacterium fentianense]|uniref:DUF979 domain-containing protein n=1 Tax=Undibacterium fentianense TaxID=2828728 RepID=A0A941E220_9BURK|nr:DUF979 domain-containing protein [Undibacterium fentianense]MBR7799632.1 DUF979 domain-containing protein [Undibacterium fentianense]
MNTVNSIFSIQIVFYLIGLVLMSIAWMSVRDQSNPKRWTTGLFWFLFGIGFLFGDWMVAVWGKAFAYRSLGMIVLALAGLAGANLLGSGTHLQTPNWDKNGYAVKLKNKLFLPAVAIPVFTVTLSLIGKDLKVGDMFLLDPKNLTLACLTIACLLSIVLAASITRGSLVSGIKESRRLVDSMGWALILPLMLAMLGGVFVAAKTGQSIQTLVTMWIDPTSKLALIITYCLGMACFTMIMGNAFAAFPVMAAGIALPFLIQQHHASPAPLVAIGMLSGYCGTLMTPMAANFNIIPAALLELKDKYKVIQYQIPTALAVLACNIVLMYFLV